MAIKLIVENPQPAPLAPLRQVVGKGDVFFVGTLVFKHGGRREARDENGWHCWSASGDGSAVIDLARLDEWWLLEDDFDLDASTGRTLQPSERLVLTLTN